MKSSIEIAQRVELRHTRQFMADFQLTDDDFGFYGKFTGKIRVELLDKLVYARNGSFCSSCVNHSLPLGEGRRPERGGVRAQ